MRPQRGAARRVADAGGEVADDQDDGVAGVLELAQLLQHDRVAEVDVGRGGVDARASRAAGRPLRELPLERALGQRVDGVADQE